MGVGIDKAGGVDDVRAGQAALCNGQVWHRRNRPTVNEFTYRASHIWIDPDAPEALTSLSPLWSTNRPGPVQIRRADYGAEPTGSLRKQLKNKVEPVLGYRPAGDVRMLTQARRWGWLFNPITVFVLWDENPDVPVAAVAEVTNTPWKERRQYPLALVPGPSSGFPSASAFHVVFDKELHVSPFLKMDYRYRLTLESNLDDLEVRIDVCDEHNIPMVETALVVQRTPPTAASLNKSAFADALRTRQVSAGIHAQALKIARKRIPFVPHPNKTRSLKDSPT